MYNCKISTVPHLSLCDDLVFKEVVEHPGELAHRKPVVGWEVTHIVPVMNHRKPAALVSHLERKVNCTVSFHLFVVIR